MKVWVHREGAKSTKNRLPRQFPAHDYPPLPANTTFELNGMEVVRRTVFAYSLLRELRVFAVKENLHPFAEASPNANARNENIGTATGMPAPAATRLPASR